MSRQHNSVAARKQRADSYDLDGDRGLDRYIEDERRAFYAEWFQYLARDEEEEAHAWPEW